MEDSSQNVLGQALGALPFVGSIAQGIIDSNQARANVDKTNAANKQLAEYQYSKDLEMWNRGNEYNAPQAQMERLKKAGLNPNLVYGSGVTGNTSGGLPHYQAPQMAYNYTPPVDIPRTLGHFQDFRIRQAQHDNLKEQNKVLWESHQGKHIANNFSRQTFSDRRFQEKMKAMKLDYDRLISKNKNQMMVDTFPHQLEMLKEKARQLHISRDLLISRIAATRAGTRYTNTRNDLAPWSTYTGTGKSIIQGLGTFLKGGLRKGARAVPAIKQMKMSNTQLLNRAAQWERRFDKP
ncbi:MAG: DNA pilot protein [Microvirus sp.]|nr:MAG: DNA pilot protein [Microvirus sp.]